MKRIALSLCLSIAAACAARGGTLITLRATSTNATAISGTAITQVADIAESDYVQLTETDDVVTIDAANARTNTYGGYLVNLGERVQGGFLSEASGIQGSIAFGSGVSATGSDGSVALGSFTTASGDYGAMALGYYATSSNAYSFVWSGRENDYGSHGDGSFSLDSEGGVAGLWIGEETLGAILAATGTAAYVAATNTAASLYVPLAGGTLDDGAALTSGDAYPAPTPDEDSWGIDDWRVYGWTHNGGDPYGWALAAGSISGFTPAIPAWSLTGEGVFTYQSGAARTATFPAKSGTVAFVGDSPTFEQAAATNAADIAAHAIAADPHGDRAYTDSMAAVVDVWTVAGTYTWTNRPGAKSVHVICIGGGGGGGSGARADTSTAKSGGGGGSGGAYSAATYSAALLGSEETVVVGAGGAGGASVTTDTTAGNIGSNGGGSYFGAPPTYRLYAGNGRAGPAGVISGDTAAAVVGVGQFRGGGGGQGKTTAASTAGSSTQFGGGGGGGGGGEAADGTDRAPAVGNTPEGATVALTAVGNSATDVQAGQPAGGGGGGIFADDTAGGAGGDGGDYGGGGGGGSAADNGYATGAGGAGGAGCVVVVTYF